MEREKLNHTAVPETMGKNAILTVKSDGLNLSRILLFSTHSKVSSE